MTEDDRNRVWAKFVSESEKRPHLLKMCEYDFLLTIFKKTIRSAEVMNYIRSIPNVTTIIKEYTIIQDEEYNKGAYTIKVSLETSDDTVLYLHEVLLKELKKIKGLSIDKYRGMREL